MFLISLQTVPIILMGQKEELNVQAVHLPEMLNTFAKGKVNNRAPCQRKSGLKVWLESLACMAHNSHALCLQEIDLLSISVGSGLLDVLRGSHIQATRYLPKPARIATLVCMTHLLLLSSWSMPYQLLLA